MNIIDKMLHLHILRMIKYNPINFYRTIKIMHNHQSVAHQHLSTIQERLRGRREKITKLKE